MPVAASDDEHRAGSALLTIDAILARVENFLNDIGGVAIFALMWLTMAEVLGRRLLNMPVPGAIDYIEVGMVLFAFIGAAYCQRQGGHVRMDLLVSNLKGRVQWAIEALGVLIAAVYIGIIVFASAKDAWRSYEFGDETIDINLTIWPSKLVVPLALAVLELRLLVQLWGYLRLIVLPDAPLLAVPKPQHVEDIAEDQIREVLGKIERDTASAGGR
jgi:TRAP-type mannitol/chloroaromatic compound transport system permease small subunit